MKSIEKSLKADIQALFDWLNDNRDITLYSDQKEDLLNIINKMVTRPSISLDDLEEIKPDYLKFKYYRDVDNDKLNDFTNSIYRLLNWIKTDGTSIYISKELNRLSALKEIINKRKVMTKEEGQSKLLQLQEIDNINKKKKTSEMIDGIDIQDFPKRVKEWFRKTFPKEEKKKKN